MAMSGGNTDNQRGTGVTYRLNEKPPASMVKVLLVSKTILTTASP